MSKKKSFKSSWSKFCKEFQKKLSDRKKKLQKKDQALAKQPVKRWARRILRLAVHLVIVLLLGIFLLWLFFGRTINTQPEDIVWGVTWSTPAIEQLQLDPVESYREVVEDLKPDKLRLVAYWNRIEKTPGVYDFSELDYQVDLAEENNIPYIISVGERTPRYPECHTPGWANEIPIDEKQAKILQIIKKTIHRYDLNPFLQGWQIENEPLLNSFGECPDADHQFLEREFALARTLTKKTIIGTDSGELSVWWKISEHPDTVGTTLYRKVLILDTDRVVSHIFPPSFYRAKGNIIKAFRGNVQDVIVAELQAEPWAGKPIVEATPESLLRTMDPEQFNANIEFTEAVGFSEAYFWGVEWWYWEKETKGQDFYWERAKELFDNQQ